VTDLEIACVRDSIHSGAALARTAPLFLNIHPSAFAPANRLHDAVIAEAENAGVSLNRIVLEITEQGSLSDERGALHTIDRLRALGVRFAFDDIGVSYSHLPLIGKVRPSFLKISQHFGTGFESDPTKRKIVRNLIALASEFESDLILEGVESEATANAAKELGIKYAQGFWFAMPADASTFAAAKRASR
jgi:EAL domain-containing protein (putative c-di-GMP-specific phosphodiesterase class I)